MSSRGSILRFARTALVLGLLLPTLAFAQSPTAKQRADARYREGLELAKGGKVEEALSKFEEAAGLSPSALATFQAARMEHALGHPRAALLKYRKSLREEGLPTAERSEATRAIEELKKKVGVIAIESPAGAVVTVDGLPVDDPKLPVEVATGSHVVKATLGGESRVVDTVLDEGKVVVVKLSFEAPPEPPKTATPTPTSRSPHESGPYWNTPRWIGVGLAGLSAVGIGFTVAFTLSHENSISKQEDLAANPRVCADPASSGCRAFNDHGDSAGTARTAAIVSAVVAGAAAAGAGILLWPRSSSPVAKGARLVPGMGSLVFTAPF